MFRIEGFAMSANIYAADWELRIFGHLNQRERLRGERLAAEAAKRRLKSASQEPAVPADENELLRASGFLAMSGQIVDATIIAAPKQRNTQEEKQALRDGRIPEDWKDKPAKLAQKDCDAGPSNTRKPSRRKMACRRSIPPSLPLTIRTTSRSTVRMV